ncbi:MAG: hypothetical protein ACTSUF_07470 [Candidatus Heimdallarchaeaceae archaeon]
MEDAKLPPSKDKPDIVFDIIIIKMMAALTFSVALLFGGGTMFVYAAARALHIPGYQDYVGAFFGIHLAILMIYYSIALFKYIISD